MKLIAQLARHFRDAGRLSDEQLRRLVRAGLVPADMAGDDDRVPADDPAPGLDLIHDALADRRTPKAGRRPDRGWRRRSPITQAVRAR